MKATETAIENTLLPHLDRDDRFRLRVLYVANRSDAPFRYRCVNACEQLRESRIVANIASIDAPDLLDSLAGYSVIVLFRLPWSKRVADLVERGRVSGATIVSDIDDFVFDPAVEPLLPFLKRMPRAKAETYRAEFRLLRQTIMAADFCVVTTPRMAAMTKRFGKDAIVHPNILSRTYVRLSRAIYPLRSWLERKPIVAYFSGSDTHDEDFDAIHEAVLQVMKKNPELSFLVCGFLQMPSVFDSLGPRVIRVPYQDYRVYPWLMAKCRAILAPIAALNDFTNSKSALKVFEAGVFGVPVIASPAEAYVSAIEPGVSGFIASKHDEWVDSINQLVNDRSSLDFGQVARRIALAKYSPDAWRGVLARELLQRCGRAEGGLPELRSLEHSPAESKRPWASAMSGLRLAKASLKLVFNKRLHTEGTASPPRGTGIVVAPETSASLETISHGIATAERKDAVLTFAGRKIGTVLVDRERDLSSARASHDVSPVSKGKARTEAWAATGPDPWFAFEPLRFDGSGARYLFVELAASCEHRTVTARLYWREAPDTQYSEDASLGFHIVADGTRRGYLIDLQAGEVSRRWPRRRLFALRFAPIDSPGEFEVTTVAFLSSLPEPEAVAREDLRARLAKRFVRGCGVEIGALQNPLHLPDSVAVRYVDRLSSADARRHYPELDGQPLVEPAILCDAHRLEPIESGSQDFVVCNHLLEHMADPIGAITEWMRVLGPGGHLFLAVPDHTNPHDRLRDVTTFEHLQEDFERREERAEEDRRHFLEWASSAHSEMSAEERVRYADQLLETGYSIHYHTFDQSLFERLLRFVCARTGAALVEVLSRCGGDNAEHIAVLRRPAEHQTRGPMRPVDIVVPVYNAREFTRCCVESVLAHASGDWRLVLVNDASTDPGISADLNEFANRDSRVRVLTNDKNQGFVATANRGMRHAEGRDVLLLNSDTEVFPEFLERLQDCAYADEATGVVSPFSNNATICSIPEFCKENAIPDGFTRRSFSDFVTMVSRQVRPELITAVGFCMYVKSTVLDRVGNFDRDSFSRGYGEENDFCERAKKAGFRIRLCDDVFVYHKSGASFGAEGHALTKENAKKLEAKHPGYAASVAHWIEGNPLASLHGEIRFHLERWRAASAPAVLYLLHASPFSASPGGTELHVRDLVATLAPERALIAYPSGAGYAVAEILDGKVDGATFFRFPVAKPIERFCIDDPAVAEMIGRWIDLFGIGGAHIHHLMNWPAGLGNLLHQAGVPFVLTSHDYYITCPSWNLFEHDRLQECTSECGKDGDLGSRCLPALFQNLGLPADTDFSSLRRRHREAISETLSRAQAIVFPSNAAREIATRRLPEISSRAVVIEHGYDGKVSGARKPSGGLLRLAAVGEIAYPTKGAAFYEELVRLSRDLAVEWHFFGATHLFGFEERLRSIVLAEKLHFHGRYNRAEIADRLVEAGSDLLVALPPWAETFSYTLSEALVAGIPALVFDRGAIGERVRRDGVGIVVRSIDEARSVLADLASGRERLDSITRRARSYRHRSLAENAEDYRDLYARAGLVETSARVLTPEGKHLHDLFDRWDVAAAAVRLKEAEAPRYQQSFWYPYFLRVKSLFPEKARRWGRRALVALESETVLTFTFKNSAIASAKGLRHVKNGRRGARFEVLSTDPQFLFEHRPFSPGSVRMVRFRMRREQEGGFAFAQVYWTHSGDAGFAEEKSAKVVLEGPTGNWQEHSIRLDTPGVTKAWCAGDKITQLRFDPTNLPGVIELDRLVLCP
ncbi:MAG: glycosyltransferase [Deltaproteobacteria bacterium]|nr:glycosyltransferase [Deltaproteobacteria bacterium]